MSKDKERFDKDLDIDPYENEVEEVDPPDLDELAKHLQDTLREHEASDDYSEEPKVEVTEPGEES